MSRRGRVRSDIAFPFRVDRRGAPRTRITTSMYGT